MWAELIAQVQQADPIGLFRPSFISQSRFNLDLWLSLMGFKFRSYTIKVIF